MKSNLSKSLSEIVSVESWYTRFSEENRESDFFMHVRFQEAVFGGEPEQSVRFRLRLRKADVVVSVEEPLKIPKSSVRRDRLNVEATYEQERTEEKGADICGEVSGEVSPLGAKGNLRLTANAAQKVGETTKSTRKLRASGTLVEHSVDLDGNNRWSFSPVGGEHLLGQAFDRTDPLMKVKHVEPMKKISPVVKVQVKCLREDIDILDLEPKTVSKRLLRRGVGEAVKLRLAEAIIKDTLASEGLEFEGVAEKFASITVADVISEDE
ncbi:hypothetical protein [Phaeobacter sp. 11ANDIMAR09]|uniref:hypothetical protein n=1 Tax=Phaeobacter sp. 11ANDIMAR09 TaxID=1225647 RepID=UPI0006D6D582|nr:hypothetical protein [Phaeobacter sp. 11ANDIMAR09]KPD12821.1 hypothetical protein AN476_07750 [Phaeobacter sp. 11ANDIMAR09]